MDYRYGYGGFGYNTSHVKTDEPHSPLYMAAKDGDLAQVQALVEKEQSQAAKLKLLNHARRWTEVDYKMSGFTKEYEWFDRTPLIIAIAQGHAPVVKYRLEQGADPTLRACPSDDVHLDAAQEAHARAKQNVNAEGQALYIKNTIQTALKFWEINKNTASSSHYNPQRTYQLPKNMKGMLEALDCPKA
jgi:ankyrin repeat protein